jgi:CRISPR/Cas system-associated protein Cas5 (RAMP superfamily)
LAATASTPSVPPTLRSGKRLISKDSVSPSKDVESVPVATECKPTLKTATTKRSCAAEVHILFSNPSSTLPLPGTEMATVAKVIYTILVSSMSSYPSCSALVRLHTKRSS